MSLRWCNQDWTFWIEWTNCLGKIKRTAFPNHSKSPQCQLRAPKMVLKFLSSYNKRERSLFFRKSVFHWLETGVFCVEGAWIVLQNNIFKTDRFCWLGMRIRPSRWPQRFHKLPLALSLAPSFTFFNPRQWLMIRWRHSSWHVWQRHHMQRKSKFSCQKI